MLVRFWPHTTNSNVASFRLRCLSIVSALGSRGLDVALYSEGDKPDVLVLSKRYDTMSLAKARALKKEHGTIICLDLCDNHFYYDAPAVDAIQRANRLMAAIALVDRVFVSSQYLAEVVRKQCGEATPVSVVGDVVERVYRYTLADVFRHPVDYVKFRILKASISQSSVEKTHRLVWFGSHGSNFTEGGMLDLKTVLPVLEAINEKHQICLTIISNSKRKYRDVFAKTTLITFYNPWSQPFFSAALSMQGISIIPIQKNPFTMAKTSNRVATSLVHDLKVVVDMIPSYEVYSPYIAAGDWSDKLIQLLSQHDVATYVLDIERENDVVINTWQKLLDRLPRDNEASRLSSDL